MIATEKVSIKDRHRATCESGDFGVIARYNEPAAAEFMGRLPLRRGQHVLDVACGSGNLAVIAAQRGCVASGVDFASNLLRQARRRAQAELLDIEFAEGDAESLPYPDGHFDATVTMFGAMFAPQPEIVAAELFRITKLGGFVAMANWTPGGFIGKMFEVFKKHRTPAPGTLPSPLLWGDETTVLRRLREFGEIRLARRMAVLRYPFSPAETVELFHRNYGPTGTAFESLDPAAQEALRRDLVILQTAHNSSGTPDVTEVRAEYLEIIARR